MICPKSNNLIDQEFWKKETNSVYQKIDLHQSFDKKWDCDEIKEISQKQRRNKLFYHKKLSTHNQNKSPTKIWLIHFRCHLHNFGNKQNKTLISVTVKRSTWQNGTMLYQTDIRMRKLVQNQGQLAPNTWSTCIESWNENSKHSSWIDCSFVRIKRSHLLATTLNKLNSHHEKFPKSLIHGEATKRWKKILNSSCSLSMNQLNLISIKRWKHPSEIKHSGTKL